MRRQATPTNTLTYHVVAGSMDFDTLRKAVMAGNGTATLTTLFGDKLVVKMSGPPNVFIQDAKGGVALFTTYDLISVQRRHPRRRQGAAIGLMRTFCNGVFEKGVGRAIGRRLFLATICSRVIWNILRPSRVKRV
jgi:hypothetical protein